MSRRAYWPKYGLILITAGLFACPLPTEEEAGKTRCNTDSDCPAPLFCANGRCGDTLDAGPSADGGRNLGPDLGPMDAGSAIVPCPMDGTDCPSGQRCHNGLCRTECQSNAACGGSEVCNIGQRLCTDRDVATCPAARCQAGQRCVGGFCSAIDVAGGACGEATNDGCPSSSICDGSEEPSVCRSFPLCPPSGNCPVGPSGGVCTSALSANDKDPMCVPFLCANASHCPTSAPGEPIWACISVAGSMVCSDGQPGAPCSADAHCLSNDCANLITLCR